MIYLWDDSASKCHKNAYSSLNDTIFQETENLNQKNHNKPHKETSYYKQEYAELKNFWKDYKY